MREDLILLLALLLIFLGIKAKGDDTNTVYDMQTSLGNIEVTIVTNTATLTARQKLIRLYLTSGRYCGRFQHLWEPVFDGPPMGEPTKRKCRLCKVVQTKVEVWQ